MFILNQKRLKLQKLYFFSVVRLIFEYTNVVWETSILIKFLKTKIDSIVYIIKKQNLKIRRNPPKTDIFYEMTNNTTPILLNVFNPNTCKIYITMPGNTCYVTALQTLATQNIITLHLMLYPKPVKYCKSQTSLVRHFLTLIIISKVD